MPNPIKLQLLGWLFAVLLGSAPMALWAQTLLIDVRSAEEFNSGHLTKAINIPHTQVTEELLHRQIAKDAEIQLYCGSGRRAGIAKESLDNAGFSQVINLGGYSTNLKGGAP